MSFLWFLSVFGSSAFCVCARAWGLSFGGGHAKVLYMNDRIEMNPRVCGGQPVIKNTRIPVEVILDQIAEGESWESVLRGYPELTRADIQAALRFARASVINSEITVLEPA